MELREKKKFAEKIINLIVDDIIEMEESGDEWYDGDELENNKKEWQRKIMLLLPNGKDK